MATWNDLRRFSSKSQASTVGAKFHVHRGHVLEGEVSLLIRLDVVGKPSRAIIECGGKA
jgi:hypothetical protein